MRRLLCVSLLVAGCAAPKNAQTPQNNLSVKKVLIIGDSISLGYWSQLKYEDTGSITFSHIKNRDWDGSDTNARGTQWALTRIDQWLDDAGSFDMVTYNQGLWDMNYLQFKDLSETPIGVTPIDQYRQNLEQIIDRIIARGKPVISFTSTQCSTASTRYPLIPSYNAVFYEVMWSRGIPVFDLYSLSAANTDLLKDGPNGIEDHWKDAGYEMFANFVLDKIHASFGY